MPISEHEIEQILSFIKGLKGFYPDLFGEEKKEVNSLPPAYSLKLQDIYDLHLRLTGLLEFLVEVLEETEKNKEPVSKKNKVKKLQHTLLEIKNKSRVVLINLYQNQLKNPPILIGGCARSGTTLLQSILSAHPDIMVVQKETNLFNDRHLENKPGKSISSRVYSVYEKYLVRERLNPDYNRWLEKTPRNIYSFKKLQDAFDDVKLIQIVRDGRDVIVSTHPSNPDKFWVGPKRWIEDVGKGAEYFRDPDIFTLRFEDLIQKFEETMIPLCDYLGISYSPYIENWFDYAKMRTNGAWSQQVVEPLDPSRIGLWKKQKFESRISFFMQHEEAVELLGLYGYLNRP